MCMARVMVSSVWFPSAINGAGNWAGNSGWQFWLTIASVSAHTTSDAILPLTRAARQAFFVRSRARNCINATSISERMVFGGSCRHAGTPEAWARLRGAHCATISG